MHFGCAHLAWTASAIGFLPVRYLFLPFFDAQALKKVKRSGRLYPKFFPETHQIGRDEQRMVPVTEPWRFENLDKSKLYVRSVPEVTWVNPF